MGGWVKLFGLSGAAAAAAITVGAAITGDGKTAEPQALAAAEACVRKAIENNFEIFVITPAFTVKREQIKQIEEGQEIGKTKRMLQLEITKLENEIYLPNTEISIPPSMGFASIKFVRGESAQRWLENDVGVKADFNDFTVTANTRMGLPTYLYGNGHNIEITNEPLADRQELSESRRDLTFRIMRCLKVDYMTPPGTTP